MADQFLYKRVVWREDFRPVKSISRFNWRLASASIILLVLYSSFPPPTFTHFLTWADLQSAGGDVIVASNCRPSPVRLFSALPIAYCAWFRQRKSSDWAKTSFSLAWSKTIRSLLSTPTEYQVLLASCKTMKTISLLAICCSFPLLEHNSFTIARKMNKK